MMRRISLLLIPFLIAGCAPQPGRSDADFVGVALRNAARALRAGRAFDNALLAEGRGDTASFARHLNAVRTTGATGAMHPAVELANATAGVRLGDALAFDSMAQSLHGAARLRWRARADEAYRGALELKPEFENSDFERLNALGYFLADRGTTSDDFKTAENYTRRAVQGWDEAIAKMKEGDAGLPLARFQRALGPRDSLAWSLFKQGRLVAAHAEQTAAIAEVRASLKSLPAAMKNNLVELLFHLGAIEAARGDVVAARAAFTEALGLDKEHDESRKALEKLPSAAVTIASL